MDEYPNEEEEFDLIYGDELELIKEIGMYIQDLLTKRIYFYLIIIFY